MAKLDKYSVALILKWCDDIIKDTQSTHAHLWLGVIRIKTEGIKEQILAALSGDLALEAPADLEQLPGSAIGGTPCATTPGRRVSTQETPAVADPGRGAVGGETV